MSVAGLVVGDDWGSEWPEVGLVFQEVWDYFPELVSLAGRALFKCATGSGGLNK